MKISFDFDSTLGEARTQKLAKKLIEEGHDIWVTTSRPEFLSNRELDYVELQHRDIYKVCNDLQIDRSKIRFTNGQDKWRFLEGFDIHFDDDRIEIELLEENLPSCIGVLIYDP